MKDIPVMKMNVFSFVVDLLKSVYEMLDLSKNTKKKVRRCLLEEKIENALVWTGF